MRPAARAGAPARPHWFLHFLAVRPQAQGRGYGSALLRPMLERCDAEGVPAYLDATSEENKRLYERHNFVVQREGHPARLASRCGACCGRLRR